MSETLLSPGVFTRENDLSFIQPESVEAGLAVVGPTVKGPVEVPTVVTSYGDYLNKFGSTFENGTSTEEYLTSMTVRSYFQQGGNTVLVTRVTSGSFSSATNSPIDISGYESNVLDTDRDALFSSITLNGQSSFATPITASNIPLVGGSGTGATVDLNVGAGTNGITSITVSNTGSGYALGDNVTIDKTTIISSSFVRGLSGVGDALLTSVTQDFSGNTYNPAITFFSVSPTTTGGGTGAVFDLEFTSSSLSSIIATSTGSGYSTGDVLVIPSASISTSLFIPNDDVELTLQSDDLVNISSTDANYSDTVQLTLNEDAFQNQTNPFTIETLGEGEIFNNFGDEYSDGSLISGSRDNLRWEITNVNNSKGTFSLSIRRGDDNRNSKIILETFNNISLDPNADNYIERVIGNQRQQINPVENYVESIGEYPNRSRYIRVASVGFTTPNYLGTDGVTVQRDNAGISFSGSLPVVSSGSFQGGVGSINVPGGRYYNQFDSSDTQGLPPSEYDDALNLLTNQDEYTFNVVTAPGLIATTHETQINRLISLAETRGDCIAVIDLVDYGSTVSQASAGADTYNTSYAASYWPFVQLNSETGKSQFVPASVVIPGVYAFTDNSSAPWFAPAGLVRGGIPGVVQAERKLSKGNRDTLYESNVNPIATFPGQGITVFGQKTLQKAASALDRVNVRRLLIDLKKFFNDQARNLVFEQNTIATRNRFLAAVNPYLESVQQRQGLYAFRVVMDDTNNTADVIDRNQLIGQVFIQPSKTAEFILLDFTIEPTGATFVG